MDNLHVSVSENDEIDLIQLANVNRQDTVMEIPILLVKVMGIWIPLRGMLILRTTVMGI